MSASRKEAGNPMRPHEADDITIVVQMILVLAVGQVMAGTGLLNAIAVVSQNDGQAGCG
ncbi:MAG: hypothetical protein ACYCUJ_06140 [Acidithiobacillus sp.]